ncbi:phage recombination protein Bet [Chelatococcus reniformis]|uniref:Phage recombination protein Bet n=1 Tax=Chelatococcus reniformis TaxID=1494448 RepID=A0A916UEW6_9HYPH|nr:phage recombination protein Bet [Chelatococcus reniformis]GGC70453.1 phage recombination protein Bet [Chelatococcus reniformis]
MNALAPAASVAISSPTWDGRMLSLIRRTVAADTNEDEFNLFIHMCRAVRLDPLRKQIYAFVFSKDDAKKRRMSIVTAIDGFRTIAERTGNYRPDEDEPTYETDEALVSDLNPAGLIKATVRVWKFSHGAWHKVTASAYWSEYAPIKDQWAYDDAERKRKPTGAKELDQSGNWPKMPRHMLAKVAEALAVRKAWPDDFSNVYIHEEVDRTRAIDLTPAELAEHGAAEIRLERIGGPSILVDWLDNEPLAGIPVGSFADRCMAFLQENGDQPAAVAMWQSRNREALRQFWSHNPSDSFEVKKEIERITSAIDGTAE